MLKCVSVLAKHSLRQLNSSVHKSLLIIELNNWKCLHNIYSLSMSTVAVQNERILQSFRTNESNPSNHTLQHEAQFYTIPSDIATKLFILGGFDTEQQKSFKTFRETSIMVRRPSIEIMNYLKRTDFSRPINRYILHGTVGNGKTFSLNHVLHYGFNEKFVLLYCPNPTDWTQWPEETAPSQFKDTRMDTPIDAAVWLQHFKSLNGALIENLDLKTTKKYVWSLREATEEGEPIKNIIEHGINRIKHASDCAAVIMREIKGHANAGRCKALVLVDRVNTFYEKSQIKYSDRRLTPVNEITLPRAFKSLFSTDWKNGAVIVTVDKKLHHPWNIWLSIEKEKKPFFISHLSDRIKDLLTRKGFAEFDPFIPVKVDKYTDKEIESVLDYYTDRMWITRPAAKTRDGRNEIKFISGFNPLDAFKICCSL